MNSIIKTLILLGAIFYFTNCFVGALTAAERDLTITRAQKVILDKFRKRVASRLRHQYMKEDIYLVRWLRAKNFNIRDAEEMFLASLGWRQRNKMDTIQQEDWSVMSKLYPFYMDTFDKEGKPILYFNPGGWDLRQIVLSGQEAQMSRYVDYSIDKASIRVRELQEKYHNVTQGLLIVNLAGYSTIQHACARCIPVILRGILTYEKHYPGLGAHFFLINTPAIFEPLLQTIRGVLSPPTNKALRVFGMNKNEWKTVLFQNIDKEQLHTELGGTKIIEPDYN